MRRRFVSVLMLGSILSSGAAFAEETAPANDDSRIVVTGERARNVASAGTKSLAPLAETPQSISVISASDIAALGLQNLNQALRFVAGVTTEQRGSSAEVYDQFKLRGFDAPQFLDGLKLHGGAGYLQPQIDLSRLDRIEVVKGPASVLYGQSGPGGLVALSSKTPLDVDFHGAGSATYGTYDLYRFDADIGGKAADDIAWRIYGSANGADTQQRFSRRERQTISGAVTIGTGGSTSLTVLAAYSHDPENGSYGVFPASGTFIKNPNGRLPTSFDGGEADNFFSREQAAITYIFNHDFAEGWSFRSSGRYQHVSSKLGIIYAGGTLVSTDPTRTLFNRASYSTREKGNSWTFDNQIRGSFETGPLQHNILLGVDRQVSHATETAAFGTATPINAYDPVYGTITAPRTPETVPNGFLFSLAPASRQQGIYAQDQISVGALRVLLSGRQDWARSVSPGATAQHASKFTYRIGALYTLPFGLAPYASYSTSFEPQGGQLIDPDGTISFAKPSIGKQIEAGAKYTVPGTEILVTGAWFRIEQTNLITSIPNTPFATQTGKVRSQGIELEASTPLPLNFNAKLAFSRQKVRTIADGNPINIGRGILGVGKGGISANLEWAPRKGPFDGFAIGGAVRHVDPVYAGGYGGDFNYSDPESFRGNTPSYTLFDALVRYDLGKASPGLQGVTLAVNAANIFNKKYLSTCYLDYKWCWYGNRRTVQGTIGYHW